MSAGKTRPSRESRNVSIAKHLPIEFTISSKYPPTVLSRIHIPHELMHPKSMVDLELCGHYLRHCEAK